MTAHIEMITVPESVYKKLGACIDVCTMIDEVRSHEGPPRFTCTNPHSDHYGHIFLVVHQACRSVDLKKGLNL